VVDSGYGLAELWGITDLHCWKVESTEGSNAQTVPQKEANSLNQTNGSYGFPCPRTIGIYYTANVKQEAIYQTEEHFAIFYFLWQ
jgi:hypothetical protein